MKRIVIWRNFLLLGSALVLSACWTSNEPLMPEGDKDGVQLEGRWITLEADSNTAKEKFQLFAKGNDIVVETPIQPDKVAHTLSFDQLQGDLYLVQILNGEGKVEAYRIFDLTEHGKVDAYDPPCGEVEKLWPGVTVEEADCTFTDYASMKSLAQKRAEGIANHDVAAGHLVKSYEKDAEE